MKPAFSHFNTSFLTTFITRFIVLRCSIEVLSFFSNRILCIQIERLIPLRYSMDQAIVSLYFLRVSSNLCYSSSVSPVAMMTGFLFSCYKKAYFKCSGKPSELLFSSTTFSLLLLDFSALFSSTLSTALFNLTLGSQNSTSSCSRY